MELYECSLCDWQNPEVDEPGAFAHLYEKHDLRERWLNGHVETT